jgi:sec-independent protein translocase protein TatA
MLNIGPAELMLIFLVALLVVGPKRLPELGRTIGKSLREFRRHADDFKQSFDYDIDDDDLPEEEPNGQDPSSDPDAAPSDPDTEQHRS